MMHKDFQITVRGGGTHNGIHMHEHRLQKYHLTSFSYLQENNPLTPKLARFI